MTTTTSSGTAVTSAVAARRARPCSGLDPVSTSSARSLPATSTRVTASGSATVRHTDGASSSQGPRLGVRLVALLRVSVTGLDWHSPQASAKR